MSQTITEHVAAEIRALSARRRITVARLAEVAGLSRMSMSKRLNGHAPFDVDELGKLATFFEVDVADLLPPAGATAVASEQVAP